MTDSGQYLLWQAGVPWTAVAGTDRQLVTHLARWEEIIWLDPPRSAARQGSSVRGWRPNFHEVAPGIRRLTVTGPPFPQRPGMAQLTRLLLQKNVRGVLRRHAIDIDVVVSTTPASDLRIVPSRRRVYYATDDFTAGAHLMGQSASRQRRLEGMRLREADVRGAISRSITEKWQLTGEVFVLPNGTNTQHYAHVESARLPEDVRLPGPIVGVVGQYSERIDLSLLEAVAQTGLSLLMVGPRIRNWGGDRFLSLIDRPNVVWVGEKAFEELPSYMRVIDVGLTPYLDSDFNRASSPLKTLEYLAAGRAVLSTPLPAVYELNTDLISCAGQPREFAEAAMRLAKTPRSRELIDNRQAFARQHGWPVRALEFLRIIGLGDAAG